MTIFIGTGKCKKCGKRDVPVKGSRVCTECRVFKDGKTPKKKRGSLIRKAFDVAFNSRSFWLTSRMHPAPWFE